MGYSNARTRANALWHAQDYDRRAARVLTLRRALRAARDALARAAQSTSATGTLAMGADAATAALAGTKEAPPFPWESMDDVEQDRKP